MAGLNTAGERSTAAGGTLTDRNIVAQRNAAVERNREAYRNKLTRRNTVAERPQRQTGSSGASGVLEAVLKNVKKTIPLTYEMYG